MDSDNGYFYNNIMESSSPDKEDKYEDETAMMRVILADAELEDEHVLNFKD